MCRRSIPPQPKESGHGRVENREKPVHATKPPRGWAFGRGREHVCHGQSPNGRSQERAKHEVGPRTYQRPKMENGSGAHMVLTMILRRPVVHPGSGLPRSSRV
jgi:hypothetical protein